MRILLGMALGLTLALALALCYRARRRRRLAQLEAILQDMAAGNLNRRLVVDERSPWAEACFLLNDIMAGWQAAQVAKQAASQANRQMLTALAHDVRTPLASLRGYLELMAQAEGLTQEARADLAVALRKARELAAFMEQLFVWFKLRSGEQRLTLARVDLAEATRQAAARWVERWEQGGWQYELALPEEAVWVLADESALWRILDNLWQNVETHSQGSTVTVSIEQREKTISLVVADDGCGMSQAELAQAFNRCYSGQRARGDGQSSGLGLAIVAELAQLLGAVPRAGHAPGGGLQVSVDFVRADGERLEK